MEQDGSPWAGYWRTGQFADLLLCLEVAGQPDSMQQLPVHRVLLAQRSSYFKSRLERNEFGDQPVPLAQNTRNSRKRGRGQTKQEPQAPAMGSALQTMKEHCATPEELAAAVAALQHAYTGKLPATDDINHLAQVCLKASYWQISATVSAALTALTQLAGQPVISADASAALLSLLATLPEQLLATAGGGQVLLEQLHQHVSARFGNATDIICSAELKQQFARLPFTLVQHWASLDSLVTDSENTVVVLLTLWADHNTCGVTADGKPALPGSQAQELSQCVRLRQLSMHFHLDALTKLWWYVSPAELPEQHALWRLSYELQQRSPAEPNDQLLGWNAVRCTRSEATLEWSLSAAQLQQLWAEETHEEFSPEVYFAGYICRAYARLIHLEGGSRNLAVFLQLEYCPELVPWCEGPVSIPLQTELDVAAGTALHRTRKGPLCTRDDSGLGWPETLKRGLQPAGESMLLKCAPLHIKWLLKLG